MADLHDIKDTTPNLDLVERLKDMLVQAESGELRSIFYVGGYDNDYAGSSWVMDARTTGNRFIGAITLGAADFTLNQLNTEKDSIFRKILESGR